ncbi:ABC transporter ATP-binding protein [Nocardioides bruguierae]|uniref:ABC transporter ATP-binding protein n=1 Tax=Nocardioides bruguierae TaxID=2945102 RepID=UPI0020214ECF|nr:ABC transporter ATP-binding protein [Nocardioides bruguierae]MCL8025749.1 ABC transporter ATP-binding protein [Nocardioides bruguierae]
MTEHPKSTAPVAAAAATGQNDHAVLVRDLVVRAENSRGSAELLHGVSVRVGAGTMHGLVGETGSGKSITASAVMGLLPKGVTVESGSILLGDRELVGAGDKELHDLRGPRFGMIFQNPRTALHPMHAVGKQMDRVLRTHLSLGKKERAERVLHYLNLVGIPDASRIARAFPHELSGGLAQRVVIATALLCDPTFLIADEPTTGLDATVQRQILELISRLQHELGLSVLMITHDLSIVAQYCDTVTVMLHGSVVEDGPVRRVLREPEAEYTRNLLQASTLSHVTRRVRAAA